LEIRDTGFADLMGGRFWPLKVVVLGQHAHWKLSSEHIRPLEISY